VTILSQNKTTDLRFILGVLEFVAKEAIALFYCFKTLLTALWIMAAVQSCCNGSRVDWIEKMQG
jgi:hypothetical protein